MTISLTEIQKQILALWAGSGLYGTTSIAETAAFVIGEYIRTKIGAEALSDPDKLDEYLQKISRYQNASRTPDLKAT